MLRTIAPLVTGLVGIAVLMSLGIWQVQRLTWKQGVLAEIDSRITAAPVAVPAVPDPEDDKYLPVTATGRYTGQDIVVLASVKQIGAVHRLIAAFVTGNGRRILVDRGWTRAGADIRTGPSGPVTLTGNLHWPDETDGWTPEPDPKTGLWFARDVPALAQALKTEPVLLVVREASPSDPAVTPLPVDSAAIPNDHLQYAITWFSLAVIWAIMTFYFLWHQRHPPKES